MNVSIMIKRPKNKNYKLLRGRCWSYFFLTLVKVSLVQETGINGYIKYAF